MIIDDGLPQNSIGLPVQMNNDFTIPDTVPYEMVIDGTNLHLGPVIALLIAKRGLTPRLMERYRGYLANYQEIKGLIYLCSLDGINPRNKTISGVYFNPNADWDASPWVQGIFPYPHVTWRRIGVSKNRLYDDLIIHTNRRIFNPYFLNKWEFWESLRANPLISNHLPHTKLLDRPQTLHQMVALYGSVYLKPTKGAKAQGIAKLAKTSNGWLYMNKNKRKTSISSLNKAWLFLRNLHKGKRYLIQQSVAMTYQNKNIDFRVVMQKNGNQEWACSGIIARYGKEGRFYTNDVSSIGLGRDALRTVYGLNEEEAARKEEDMIQICTLTCQILDSMFGSFGDVGIDATVDPNLKVWLLEINSLHQHSLASYLQDDRQMYGKVLTQPLAYAKAWSGFSRYNQS